MSSNIPVAWTLPQYEATTIENDGVNVFDHLPSRGLKLTYLDIGESI
jgi:hypothetical protein